MKKIIVSALFVALSLTVVSCTCSREKEKAKELELWSACSEKDQADGLCGEKKMKGPRSLRINPRQLTLNRDLINRAFNEQVKKEQGPTDQPEAQKETLKTIPAPGPENKSEEKGRASGTMPVTKPALSSKAIRVPVSPAPAPSRNVPKEGAAQ